MSRHRSDSILLWALRVVSAVAGGIVLLVVLHLFLGSWPALKEVGILRFVSQGGWHPTEGGETGEFNLVPMLVGSLASTLGAMLLAGPLGIMAAAFGRYYAPKGLRIPYRRMLELMAGIPSVVYGFWGLVVLAPIIRQLSPPGTSLLAGILILTLMIVPTVALLADAAFRSIPEAHLQSAAALSLSRSTTLLGVVLPAARSNLSVAWILGTTRAIGETMAVLMVCGNIVQVPRSLFAPIRTLTANIALELGYATSSHRSVLFVSGLLLMALVVLLVTVVEWMKRGDSHG